MSKKTRTNEQRTCDPAVREVLDWLDKGEKCDTIFSRAEEMTVCKFGQGGACCNACFMGPCRFPKPGSVGRCGVNLATVAMKRFVRMVLHGAAAHSDHGRDMARVLLGAATGHAPDFNITDEAKLRKMAGYLNVDHAGKTKEEVGEEVALAVMAQFGGQLGELLYFQRAPQARIEKWRKYNLLAPGVDMTASELAHRLHMGVDNEPINLLIGGMRAALADGWGGSMMATEITDVLFGTPKPVKGHAGLTALDPEMVNIVIHGHEPTLAEKVVEAGDDLELVNYAKSKGAKGINFVGICCTANEILMREGVSVAGPLLSQGPALHTGVVEAMVVDVQCIMPAMFEVAKNYHTKVISTSPKARFPDEMHIPYEEEKAGEIARKIVKLAVDNFSNRTEKGCGVPEGEPSLAMVGFSHEYIEYMQGGKFRGSFQPLNDAIISGRIRGIAAVVGCNNPKVKQNEGHLYLTQKFIENDVLVVMTGCGAIAAAQNGYMVPEAIDLKKVGPGLREVCETIGIPPVLHMGSCVDNSRILTVGTQIVATGGLGEDLSDLPAVGYAPEWMSEKAMSIALYVAASGVEVICGVGNPVGMSEETTDILNNKLREMMGAGIRFIVDPKEMFKVGLAHIDAQREKLNIKKYEKGKFGTERKLMDMKERQKLK